MYIAKRYRKSVTSFAQSLFTIFLLGLFEELRQDNFTHISQALPSSVCSLIEFIIFWIRKLLTFHWCKIPYSRCPQFCFKINFYSPTLSPNKCNVNTAFCNYCSTSLIIIRLHNHLTDRLWFSYVASPYLSISYHAEYSEPKIVEKCSNSVNTKWFIAIYLYVRKRSNFIRKYLEKIVNFFDYSQLCNTYLAHNRYCIWFFFLVPEISKRHNRFHDDSVWVLFQSLEGNYSSRTT